MNTRYQKEWVGSDLPLVEKNEIEAKLTISVLPILERGVPDRAAEIFRAVVDSVDQYVISTRAKDGVVSITDVKQGLAKISSAVKALKDASDILCSVSNDNKDAVTVSTDIAFQKLLKGEPNASFILETLIRVAADHGEITKALSRLENKLPSFKGRNGDKDQEKILAALVGKAFTDCGLQAPTTRNPDVSEDKDAGLFRQVVYSVFEVLKIKQSADDAIKNHKRVDIHTEGGLTTFDIKK
jgi:hypothetical protein